MRWISGRWFAAALGLLALLLALGTLQYRWIDRASRADRARSLAGLSAAADAFARDFDRLLSQAALAFLPRPGMPSGLGGDDGNDGTADDLPDTVAQRYRRWQAGAPYPELVRAVFLVRPGAGASPLLRVDATGEVSPAVWPPELEPLAEVLGGEWRWRDRRRPAAGARRPPVLWDRPPALLLPGFEPPRRERPMARPESPATRSGMAVGPLSAVIVWLDREAIVERVLPDLAARHFGAGAADEPYVLAVVESAPPRGLVFQRGLPAGASPPAAGDATAELFGLLPVEALGPLASELGRSPALDPDGLGPAGPPSGPRAGPTRRPALGYELVARASPPRWRLVASHPAGSVAAAVAAARRRNLALGLGILGVLGASLLLLGVATGRARRLARQQLEFVAGVTHELRTPLAAMRSAAQNLADGVVTGAEQVKRYGAMIDEEGRRLSTMVERVLGFAGMQAGRRGYAVREVDLSAVVEDALATHRAAIEREGIELEVDLADALPPLRADPTALRQALENLIGNALKYGREGRWLRIAASPSPAASADAPEVSIVVADRGPGIDRVDLPHLFEPFYRGRRVAEEVAGSGLGLALVRDVVAGHGGRVEIDNRPGEGVAFTLRWPAAVAPDAAVAGTAPIASGAPASAVPSPRAGERA